MNCTCKKFGLVGGEALFSSNGADRQGGPYQRNVCKPRRTEQIRRAEQRPADRTEEGIQGPQRQAGTDHAREDHRSRGSRPCH